MVMSGQIWRRPIVGGRGPRQSEEEVGHGGVWRSWLAANARRREVEEEGNEAWRQTHSSLATTGQMESCDVEDVVVDPIGVIEDAGLTLFTCLQQTLCCAPKNCNKGHAAES